jgi:hypothetical protein
MRLCKIPRHVWIALTNSIQVCSRCWSSSSASVRDQNAWASPAVPGRAPAWPAPVQLVGRAVVGGVGRRSRPRPHYPLAVTESRLRLYLRPWFGEKPSKRIGPADNRRWQAHLEELDLANRRARVHSKGGAVEWVFWQTGSAQLLPRLLTGRTGGPVFLGDRRPARPVAGLDLDPASGRRLPATWLRPTRHAADRDLPAPLHEAPPPPCLAPHQPCSGR